MNKKNILILLMVIAITSFTGCTSKDDSTISEYKKITAAEAKEMMDQDESILILDVRTEEEFNSGHIEGAILLPDYEIADQAVAVLNDKAATILVYCRSGQRSAGAVKTLNKLGYTNIIDFGGINDWTYEIVSE